MMAAPQNRLLLSTPASPVRSQTTHPHPHSHPYAHANGTAGGGSRVWVSQEALDYHVGRLQPSSSLISATGTNSNGLKSRASTSGSTATTATATIAPSIITNSTITITTSSSLPPVSPVTVVASNSSGSGASILLRRTNSNHSVFNNSNHLYPSDTESNTDNNSHSSHGRNLTYGWKSGWLLESSGGDVIVRLDEELGSVETTAGPGPSSLLDQNPHYPVVRLSQHALRDGQVLLSNDYQIDAQGIIQPPSDLVTLTHLHEPSVVECLQYRYSLDQIYTSTGPVLLALNPFQPLRGLYGENTMKKYWEKAERGLSTSELPPHVYAIADESFRNMMRALEDRRSNMSVSSSSFLTMTSTSPYSTPPSQQPASSERIDSTASTPSGPNQSILVSGESGAGKTVTTKFVMKYLAALSQRSTVLIQPEKRAYLRATDNHLQHGISASTLSTSYSSAGKRNGSATSRSAFVSKSFHAKTSTNGRKSSVSTAQASAIASASRGEDLDVGGGLDSVAILSSSSTTEAQVLQSNPILESFGNARTVRNDNSSRFGKFIEIQFTSCGKLVGASIETYLLEKVRLVTQNSGERNYHVFYELLSGSMDTDDLKVLGLARSSCPGDFKMLSSGTVDRRDGVSDQETYRQLRMAMETMNFSKSEVSNIFFTVAAILHASNLVFIELPGETSTLDLSNSNQQAISTVCRLLGVDSNQLNQAMCTTTIQAGRENAVVRSFNRSKAEKGLEAILKATYGALFTYLVKRINDSIAFSEEELDGELDQKPAASIGVLDIFGFESFNTNSFEQLCINYCNEALQQQFNAFVLKNEQAEYEREGIEWSFIEFPENQDVLDLIEKRGTGILYILDDQCKAPGPSDKAFALDVYSKCNGLSRFVATRKQTATLKFAISHYAGQIEYTTTGFTEKNRDELPKEAGELLRCSSNPFIQQLADIIDQCQTIPVTSQAITGKLSAQLRRADSIVGRATVGGQFRKQLRNLRTKIDLTTPHYIRCLKPNDLLVPDHFDQAIVAEQLRCGGILEAVRVARAGFTQHYPHADFVRRYRTLAWKELAKKDLLNPSSHSTPWTVPTLPRTAIGSPKGFPNQYTQNHQNNSFKPDRNKNELSSSEAKILCKDLIRVLCRKLYLLSKEDCIDIDGVLSPSENSSPTAAIAKAKTYSFTPATPPSWSKQAIESTLPTTNGHHQLSAQSSSLPPASASRTGSKPRSVPWERKSPTKLEKKTTTPLTKPAATAAPRINGSSALAWKRSGVTTTDYAKAYIQMGKTKVFLRHKAFEALERIRSRDQTRAATLLNSLFRMYLARMAYVPYRDAFRVEMSALRRRFEEMEDYKESKEPDYIDDRYYEVNGGSSHFPDSTFSRFRASIILHAGSSMYTGDSLVDKWLTSKVKDAIHNPVPRHEWGKQGPSHEAFKWVLSEGIWVKNYG